MRPINDIAKRSSIMIDNAATASQCRALVDDAVVREAITLNIVAPLLVEISERDARIATLEAEASEGERRGLERAAEVAQARAHLWLDDRNRADYTDNECLAASAECSDIAKAIRALIPEAPAREGE